MVVGAFDTSPKPLPFGVQLGDSSDRLVGGALLYVVAFSPTAKTDNVDLWLQESLEGDYSSLVPILCKAT